MNKDYYERYKKECERKLQENENTIDTINNIYEAIVEKKALQKIVTGINNIIENTINDTINNNDFLKKEENKIKKLLIKQNDNGIYILNKIRSSKLVSPRYLHSTIYNNVLDEIAIKLKELITLPPQMNLQPYKWKLLYERICGKTLYSKYEEPLIYYSTLGIKVEKKQYSILKNNEMSKEEVIQRCCMFDSQNLLNKDDKERLRGNSQVSHLYKASKVPRVLNNYILRVLYEYWIPANEINGHKLLYDKTFCIYNSSIMKSKVIDPTQDCLTEEKKRISEINNKLFEQKPKLNKSYKKTLQKLIRNIKQKRLDSEKTILHTLIQTITYSLDTCQSMLINKMKKFLGIINEKEIDIIKNNVLHQRLYNIVNYAVGEYNKENKKEKEKTKKMVWVENKYEEEKYKMYNFEDDCNAYVNLIFIGDSYEQYLERVFQHYRVRFFYDKYVFLLGLLPFGDDMCGDTGTGHIERAKKFKNVLYDKCNKDVGSSKMLEVYNLETYQQIVPHEFYSDEIHSKIFKALHGYLTPRNLFSPDKEIPKICIIECHENNDLVGTIEDCEDDINKHIKTFNNYMKENANIIDLEKTVGMLLSYKELFF